MLLTSFNSLELSICIFAKNILQLSIILSSRELEAWPAACARAARAPALEWPVAGACGRQRQAVARAAGTSAPTAGVSASGALQFSRPAAASKTIDATYSGAR